MRRRGVYGMAGSGFLAVGFCLFFPCAAVADETPFVLPSGLVAHLQEVISDPAGGAEPVYRYRFVSPDFTNAGGLDRVVADLEHLCMSQALPALPDQGRDGVRIIVSLADAPSEFGAPNPDITQVFEAYRVENDACIWEVF